MKGVIIISNSEQEIPDISKMEDDLLKDNKFQIMPFAYYEQFSLNQKLYFMKQHGMYLLPTTEVIDHLKEIIELSAIEVYAGNGALGRGLNIPITDNLLQRNPNVKARYESIGDAICEYGDDVEELDALAAVAKYKPTTVVSSYPSFVEVDKIELKMFNQIKKYIMLGNLQVHGDRPLFTKQYKAYWFKPLIMRTKDQNYNRIFIWKR